MSQTPRVVLKLVLAFFFLLAFKNSQEIVKVNFEQSMGIASYPQYKLMLRGRDSLQILNFYKNMFEKNLDTAYSETTKVPKIIHHIWVGSKPIPELYRKYAEQCRKVNPEWEYKLWTEKEIFSENFDPRYMKLFEDMGYRYSGKKDIVEYLLLHRYGGIVMDMDFECIKPFNILSHRYDFFASLEPGVYWSKIPVMSNAIIGSVPDNKIFLETLDMAIKINDKNNAKFNSGARLLFRKIKSLYNNKPPIKVSDSREIFMQSFASKFRESSGFYKAPIVFPATYFNPIFPDQYKKYDFLDKLRVWGGFEKGDNYFTQIRLETIAVQDFYD